MPGQPDLSRQGGMLIVALYRRFNSSSEGKRALTRLLNATVRMRSHAARQSDWMSASVTPARSAHRRGARQLASVCAEACT
jgi:hypothetical protein